MSDYDFSNLDFNELKADLIEYIKNSDEFKDYNFDGSALNSIANLLTYVTLQQNYYLNMTTQELFLDSATLYKNAVVIAKSLNYIPHRRIAASIAIELVVDDPILDGGAPIEIPQRCLFLVGGKTFITDEAYNIYDSTPESIALYQREIVEETFTFDGTEIELINGYNIDEDLLTVTVDDVTWELYENNITGTGESLIYFVDTNLDGRLVITFGDNIIGQTPIDSAEIIVTYGLTEGVDGNNLLDANLNQTIYSGAIPYTDSDVTITTDLSSGGLDEEELSSIKANAPKFYETQNRIVTADDYKSLLLKLSYVEIVNVWSGETATPPVYGTVFVTVKPTGIDLLTSIQKTEILSYLNQYVVLSIKPVIIDPIYIYVDTVSTVKYFSNEVTSTTTLRNEIVTIINEYFDDQLSSFDSLFKYSRLLESIDNVDGVSNNLTDVNPHLRFDRHPTDSYYFIINNEIIPGTIINEFVIDDGAGKMLLVSDNSEIGTVTYSTGEIQFNTPADLMNDVLGDLTDLDVNKLYFTTIENDINFTYNTLVRSGDETITLVGI